MIWPIMHFLSYFEEHIQLIESVVAYRTEQNFISATSPRPYTVALRLIINKSDSGFFFTYEDREKGNAILT